MVLVVLLVVFEDSVSIQSLVGVGLLKEVLVAPSEMLTGSFSEMTVVAPSEIMEVAPSEVLVSSHLKVLVIDFVNVMMVI